MRTTTSKDEDEDEAPRPRHGHPSARRPAQLARRRSPPGRRRRGRRQCDVKPKINYPLPRCEPPRAACYARACPRSPLVCIEVAADRATKLAACHYKHETPPALLDTRSPATIVAGRRACRGHTKPGWAKSDTSPRPTATAPRAEAARSRGWVKSDTCPRPTATAPQKGKLPPHWPLAPGELCGGRENA